MPRLGPEILETTTPGGQLILRSHVREGILTGAHQVDFSNPTDPKLLNTFKNKFLVSQIRFRGGQYLWEVRANPNIAPAVLAIGINYPSLEPAYSGYFVCDFFYGAVGSDGEKTGFTVKLPPEVNGKGYIFHPRNVYPYQLFRSHDLKRSLKSAADERSKVSLQAVYDSAIEACPSGVL